MAAQVEGDIAEVDGVLRITQIRLQYSLSLAEKNEAVEQKIARALEAYSEKCPAYQSVKGCIECTWSLESVLETT